MHCCCLQPPLLFWMWKTAVGLNTFFFFFFLVLLHFSFKENNHQTRNPHRKRMEKVQMGKKVSDTVVKWQKSRVLSSSECGGGGCCWIPDLRGVGAAGSVNRRVKPIGPSPSRNSVLPKGSGTGKPEWLLRGEAVKGACDSQDRGTSPVPAGLADAGRPDPACPAVQGGPEKLLFSRCTGQERGIWCWPKATLRAARQLRARLFPESSSSPLAVTCSQPPVEKHCSPLCMQIVNALCMRALINTALQITILHYSY